MEAAEDASAYNLELHATMPACKALMVRVDVVEALLRGDAVRLLWTVRTALPSRVSRTHTVT